MAEKSGILILGKLPPPYMGPAIATRIILNSSLQDHYELHHFDTRINRRIDTMGRFHLGKAFRSIGLYFALWGMILRRRPALVLIPISQTTMGFAKDALYIWIARLCFRKVVVQLRGSNWKNWLGSASGLTRWWVRFTLKGTSGVIVLGQNLRHLFEDIYPPEKIYVVSNGADYEIPHREIGAQKQRWLYLANFLPTKGFDNILRGLSELKKRGKDGFELHAVGAWDNPTFEQTCKDMVSAEELPVQFYPPASGDAKWEHLALADAFIFTPRAPEGHPWVIVEAMAAGLPVIATDQGAIVESVLDGKTGFIVPVDDPNTLADRLEYWLNNPEQCNQMGTESHQHYQHNFTEQAMVTNLKKCFDSVLQKSSSN